jgi:hypothetical protein
VIRIIRRNDGKGSENIRQGKNTAVGGCASLSDLLLYAFFWVIPRRLKFICRRFGRRRKFEIK